MFNLKLQLISIFKYIDKLSLSALAEDVFTFLTKVCSDCEFEWSRDLGRSGFDTN